MTMYSTKGIYPVFLSKEELLKVEEALYDKSNILSIIARQKASMGDSVASSRATAKSIDFERLAGKVGLPLDEIYKNEYNSNIKTKENN